MIKGLYETHVFVKNLELSLDFYTRVLGLEQCHFDAERRIAFLWIGKPKEAMLGLWEKPASEIDQRHFAFRCDLEDILYFSEGFFKERDIKPYNFLKDGTTKPMVFAWTPALAIYFRDPDGHELEFIAVIDGDGRPEWGIVSYEEWLKRQSFFTHPG